MWTGTFTHEIEPQRSRFLKEFGPRVAELLDRLQKAAGVRELRTMADLDIPAAHPPSPDLSRGRHYLRFIVVLTRRKFVRPPADQSFSLLTWRILPLRTCSAPLITILGRGAGTGAAESADRGERTGATILSLQQCWRI